MSEYSAVCKVCLILDTKCSNGDVDWCNECYSVEQDFHYVTEIDDLLVNEDGDILDEDNFNIIGSLL